MISQAAARLLRALGLALQGMPPPGDPGPAYLPSPPWTGLRPRSRRPARCERGYASPYPTPVATHDPPPCRK